jgi:hypothetical protein
MRRLTRWDKEVELLVKLGYYGLTTGRGECAVALMNRHLFM